MSLNNNWQIFIGSKFIAILLVVLLSYSCDRVEPESPKSIASLANSSELSDSNQANASREQNTISSPIDESRKNAITNVVTEVSPAVVSIAVTEVVRTRKRLYNEFFNRYFFSRPFNREIESIGSGFIISEEGLVVTNAHVANENAKEIIVSLPDGSQYKAELLGADVLADIALLKIQADRTFPYVTFGNSKEVIAGEWAIAIGNPFGLFESAQPSVTVGVVSATQRDFRPNPKEPRVYLDMIQTDAAINQGNSGGPLVNSEGKVIGINTFIYTGGTGRGFIGLGFAIPSNRAKNIIHELAAEGEYKKSYDLGMETTPMTYQLVMNNNLPAVMGLFVTNVNRDGPAFKSGVMPGDIILKIGNNRVQSQMHARALFREYEVGDSMRVELLRNGRRYETKILLRERVTEN